MLCTWEDLVNADFAGEQFTMLFSQDAPPAVPSVSSFSHSLSPQLIPTVDFCKVWISPALAGKEGRREDVGNGTINFYRYNHLTHCVYFQNIFISHFQKPYQQQINNNLKNLNHEPILRNAVLLEWMFFRLVAILQLELHI